MGYGVNGLSGLNGGYPGYPVGGPGGLGGPSFPSGIYPPGSDQFVGSGTPKKKGVAGFFQGILNAAVNTIKSVFTFQGILTMAGAGALVWATGGAALIPLAALGAGMGGFQMLNGLAKGDSEAVGEGFFVTATSLLGLKYTPKEVNLNGQAFTLRSSVEGQKLGITGRLKALWGGNKFVSADGTQPMNIWQIGANKLSSRFRSPSSASNPPSSLSSQTSSASNPSSSVSSQPSSVSNSRGFDSLKPEIWQTRKDVEGLKTLKMDFRKFEQEYQKAHTKLTTLDGSSQDFATASKVNRAGGKLRSLEAKALRPDHNTWEWYIREDNRLLTQIGELKLKKRINLSDNFMKERLNHEIQELENLRGLLFGEFKKLTVADVAKRQNVMKEINPDRSFGDSSTSSARSGSSTSSNGSWSNLGDDVSSITFSESSTVRMANNSSIPDSNSGVPNYVEIPSSSGGASLSDSNHTRSSGVSSASSVSSNDSWHTLNDDGSPIVSSKSSTSNHNGKTVRMNNTSSKPAPSPSSPPNVSSATYTGPDVTPRADSPLGSQRSVLDNPEEFLKNINDDCERLYGKLDATSGGASVSSGSSVRNDANRDPFAQLFHEPLSPPTPGRQKGYFESLYDKLTGKESSDPRKASSPIPNGTKMPGLTDGHELV